MLGVLLQATTAATDAATAVADTTSSGDEGGHILSLIWHADIVVQLTLFILFAFSVVCWAIIIMKHRQLKTAKQRMNQFLTTFWQAKTLESLMTRGSFPKSPMLNIFKTGIASLREQNGAKNNVEFIQRDIDRTASDEVEQLEYSIPFLATTASAAPFIGLFGTVWGILTAFFKIGQAGSSSLAIVGPHIAEALIATAVGLAAAIPAVIFYNLYVNKIRLLSREIHQFSTDLDQRIQKEYFAR
ncbi:MAG: hypothetical protein COV45_06205 [Deltaproteobacteria bacterium CG11_big_fil_rev_8_21_14_0_20_47_16]|nr:MAG: hypothetical protein COV45_06205 [Deltaproteobacteria bacterium CG11_big_fil_rev_8_21_14_0_20_47_16]